VNKVTAPLPSCSFQILLFHRLVIWFWSWNFGLFLIIDDLPLLFCSFYVQEQVSCTVWLYIYVEMLKSWSFSIGCYVLSLHLNYWCR
jgi:hypothetical protein